MCPPPSPLNNRFLCEDIWPLLWWTGRGHWQFCPSSHTRTPLLRSWHHTSLSLVCPASSSHPEDTKQFLVDQVFALKLISIRGQCSWILWVSLIHSHKFTSPMQTYKNLNCLQCVMKQTLCPQEPVKLLLFINLDPHNLKWFHRSLPVVKVFLKRPSAATGIRRYLIVQHTGEFGVQIKQSKTLHNVYKKFS